MIGSCRDAPEVYSFPSRLGWIAIAGVAGCLCDVTFGHRSRKEAQAALLRRAGFSEPRCWDRSLADRLQAFARGELDDFLDVRLSQDGLTDFQRRVLERCRRIPPGQTLSYGALAAAVGAPGAARAVGNAMARNRCPLVVPCHRVVNSDGSIGRYSAPRGIAMKARLLALERAGASLCIV
jgi:methylated-DNA-[protein]-cysteine S-methyltransferase